MLRVVEHGASPRRTWFSFFFSSRRRHTRYWRDWSSDVCSSDLLARRPLSRAEYFTAPTRRNLAEGPVFGSFQPLRAGDEREAVPARLAGCGGGLARDRKSVV